jgi:hypothetical protein
MSSSQADATTVPSSDAKIVSAGSGCHGGRVQTLQAPGEGSTVSFTLPAA